MTDNGKSEIGLAILGVMGEVGYVQKEKKGGLPYSFAGEAALIKALRPAMQKHGIVCYVSDIVEIRQESFETKKGTVMNHVTAHGIVTFMHPESATFIDVHAMGEGMDAGDKAGNKAATGLLKYALRQTFLIETGDDPDATSSNGQERETEPAWPPAFITELKAQGIVKQKNHAESLMELSPFEKDADLQDVMRWALIYRARRADGLKTKEAAHIATSEYEVST